MNHHEFQGVPIPPDGLEVEYKVKGGGRMRQEVIAIDKNGNFILKSGFIYPSKGAYIPKKENQK